MPVSGKNDARPAERFANVEARKNRRGRVALASRLRNEAFNRRLFSYLLAGSAASVAGNASLSSASAGVTYSGIQNLTVPQNGSPVDVNIFGSGNLYSFDYGFDPTPSGNEPIFRIYPHIIRSEISIPGISFDARLYSLSSSVNGSAFWGGYSSAAIPKVFARYSTNSTLTTPSSPGAQYLGVRERFNLSDYRYGWVQVDIPSNLSGVVKIVDWAYETDLNTPILTGN
ncbi:MAG: hypothetical protein ACKN9S_07300, partial [Pirellula sp.]